MQWLQSRGQKDWEVDSFDYAYTYKAKNYTKRKQAQIRLKGAEVIEGGKREKKKNQKKT